MKLFEYKGSKVLYVGIIQELVGIIQIFKGNNF